MVEALLVLFVSLVMVVLATLVEVVVVALATMGVVPPAHRARWFRVIITDKKPIIQSFGDGFIHPPTPLPHRGTATVMLLVWPVSGECAILQARDATYDMRVHSAKPQHCSYLIAVVGPCGSGRPTLAGS